MVTRLYLRADAPTNDPGETTNSAVLPVGDFQDSGNSVGSLNLAKGVLTAVEAYSVDSLGHLDHDDDFFTSFSTEALAAQTIDANTWDIGLLVNQQSAFANSFIVCVLYTFRQGTGVIDFMYDSDTPLGNEWATGSEGREASFSASASTVLENDYLVFEVWRHTDGQGMNMSYGQNIRANGSETDVVEGDGGNAQASWIETPQDLNFAGAARRVIIID